MKYFYLSRVLLCLFVSFFFSRSSSYGQCSATEVSQVISYDTLLLGGGNDLFTFNFPQFDLTLGTLVKVDIETIITVKYFYTLENTDGIPVSYKVRVNRSDDIFCSALQTPLSNEVLKVMNTHNLGAYDGVLDSGPDYVSRGPVYPFNNYIKNYSTEGDVAGFLGTGNVTFDYSSITDSYPSGSSHYLYNTSATDSIHFTLKYYYCATTFLPAGLKNFTASKRSEELVQLNWSAPNDQAGKKYEIQKSTDGRTFSAVETIVSTSNTASNYQISYIPVKGDKNKLFFRVRESNDNGPAKYSAIRSVILRLEESLVMKVYPTVAINSVNIFFPGKGRDDWQVNLISLSGYMVQKAQFSKTNFIKWPIMDQVSAGFYIVEAINKRTLESQQSKIIVQR